MPQTTLRLFGATLLIAAASAASAQCDSVTVTTRDQLDAAVVDYNTNCVDGDELTVTLGGTVLLQQGLNTLNNSSTAVLRIVDGTLQGSGETRLMNFTAGYAIFERTLLQGFRGNNGGIGRVNDNAVVSIINTTVTGNAASSGAAFSVSGGTLNLVNATVAGNTQLTNGGSIFVNPGVLNMRNSILADTVNSNGDSVPDCVRNSSGTVTFSDGQSNLIEQDGSSACDPSGEALQLDPGLLALADNGGPAFTMALGSDSPAVDAGSDAAAVDAEGATLETDARGPEFPRVVGTAVDLGAFELGAPADFDGDGTDDSADNCLEVANADQRDTDGDGFGNVCDADLNNDLAINFGDLGLMKQRFFTTDADADLDGDGQVNFLDLGLMKEAFFGEPGPSAIAP